MDEMNQSENINHQEEIDEIVTVEPGEVVAGVEEEIANVTPVKEKTEEDKADEVQEVNEETPEEVKEEVPVEDEKEDTGAETSDVPSDKEKDKEEPSEEKKEEEGEKPEESDDADAGNDSDEENAKEVPETVDEDAEINKKLEEVTAELERMKEEEQSRKMIEERDSAIEKASKTYEKFSADLGNAVLDTFKQYGIDPEISIDELKKDPAKYQVAVDIMNNAQRLQAEKQAELAKPIEEATRAIVFREAGKVMANFDMTEEQTQVCAETLINIFDATGLADLDADLKAKVELAVARAKMIAPKVEKVVDEVKEIIDDTKEAVKDVIDADANKKEEEIEPTEEDTKEEPKVEIKEEKPSLDAFKEGATANVTETAPANPITKDNVLDMLGKIPFKQRAAFFKANQKAINEAMTEKYKNLGNH